MESGFTAELPPELIHPSQSHSQINQSQESIVLSDDEINYSMKKDAVQDEDNLQDEYCNYDWYVPSPIDFNLIDGNSNTDSDEKLMNQSVCNILEKTFDHCTSPIFTTAKTTTIGKKSLKKVSSETVLSSRYGNSVASTSCAKKIQSTPDKKTTNLELIQKQKNSPFSQPIVETRMDLSNNEYHIRIGSVSPKPNYDEMDASTLETELRKFGLKPSLRRRQAIICLEYIYNRTHPFMENISEMETSSKLNEINEFKQSNDIPKDDGDDSSSKINYNIGFAAQNLVDQKFKNRDINKIFLPSTPRAKVICF